ncbi:Os09g0274266, partial [Oryza sativa Japonica Group]
GPPAGRNIAARHPSSRPASGRRREREPTERLAAAAPAPGRCGRRE